MGHIAVDNLEHGMILSEDVRDINTRLLLSKGQKLDPKHIRILKIWGVLEVNIVGSVETKSAEKTALDSEIVQQVKSEVGRIFRHVDLNHPLVSEICQASLVYRLRGDFAAPPAITYPTDAQHQDLSQPDSIRRRIQQIEVQLPETPTIIHELNAVIADPLATSNDVAQVVNRSPSLAALLLRIVNSAYYGFPSRIDRISRAVTIIGTKEISGLALGISVMQAFDDIPSQIINMQAFIRHSLACGMIARILAALKNMHQTEQLFVSGLLHDIGKLLIFKYYPQHAKAYLRLAASSTQSVFNCEKEIIGVHHTHVAQFLLKKWKLPADLENNVVFHHSPSQAAEPVKAAIVQLADMITHGLGIGSSAESSIPAFDAEAMDKLGLCTQTIHTVIRQAVHQLGPMEAIFNG